MSGGRTYVDKVTIGGVDVFEVTSSPDGVVEAPRGSLAIRSDVAETWQNTDGAMAWSRMPFDVLKQQVQLGDLPVGTTTTGPVLVGPMVAAHRPILGGMLYMSVDVDPGVSSITNVRAQWGVAAGGIDDSSLFTADGLELIGETDTPKYLHGLNSSSSIEDEFSKAPGVSAQPTQLFYEIDSTGGDLDELVAFDVTFIALVSPATLTVP
jgi:hypothetical protein